MPDKVEAYSLDDANNATVWKIIKYARDVVKPGDTLTAIVTAQLILRRSGAAVALVSLAGLGGCELLWQLAADLGANPGVDEEPFRLWRRLSDRLAELRYEQVPTVLLLDDRTAGHPDMQLESLCHGVLTMEQEQAKREQLLGDPARLAEYAVDKGLPVSEMRELLQANHRNNAPRLARYRGHHAALQRPVRDLHRGRQHHQPRPGG